MVRQLRNRTLRFPDPHAPGRFITVKDPLAVIAGCSRAHCPICNHLKAQLEGPDRTMPPPAPLLTAETSGFEMVH